MLLAVLQEDEKLAFAALAKKLIASDGVFDTRELQMFDGICREMGLPDECVIPANKEVQELSETFKSKNNKAFAMLELYSLALCDNDYADEEEKLIIEIAKFFDIEDSDLEGMKKWAEKRVSLAEDIKPFLVFDN